jgi:hypothetical protein
MKRIRYNMIIFTSYYYFINNSYSLIIINFIIFEIFARQTNLIFDKYQFSLKKAALRIDSCFLFLRPTPYGVHIVKLLPSFHSLRIRSLILLIMGSINLIILASFLASFASSFFDQNRIL